MNTSIRKKYLIEYNEFSDTLMLCKNSSVLFGIAFVIYLVVMISRTSFFAHTLMLDNGLVYRFVIYGCLALLALKEYIIGKQSFTFVIHMIIIFLLCILIKNVNSFAASASVLFLFSSRNEDFRYVAKIALIVTSAMLFIIIFLSLVGVIQNYEFDAGSSRPRFFLGFGYALFPPAYFFNIAALILYLKKDRINIVLIFLEAVVNYWLYIKTDSRLSYGLTLFVIISSLVIKVPIKKLMGNRRYLYNPVRTAFTFGIVILFVLSAFLSIGIIIKYDSSNEFQSHINSVLTWRLEYGKRSYEEYGLKAFGQNIEWVGNGLDSEGNSNEDEYLYVDNLYLQFAQHYGWVLFLTVMMCITYGMYRLIKEKEWVIVFVLVLIALHAVLDDLVLHIWYNTFWMALTPMIFRDNIVRKYILGTDFCDGSKRHDSI